MPRATVQVPVLMSRAQKRRLAQKAKAANLTMGQLLREGGERYSPNEDPAILDHFAKLISQATRKAIRSIDKTLALVAQSEARIHAMTKAKKNTRPIELTERCGTEPIRKHRGCFQTPIECS